MSTKKSTTTAPAQDAGTVDHSASNTGIEKAIAADQVAKVSRKAAAAPAGTVTMLIDPTKIKRREGWNPRFDFGEVNLLAASIAHELSVNPGNGGLINDLRVEKLAKKDNGYEYELIDGDRRLSAIEILIKKGTTFPIGVGAKVEPARTAEEAKLDDKDQLVRMYTANTGKSFLPMEEALSFERMKKAGMKQAEIEKATGRSHGVVARAFLLLKADKRLKDAVEAKTLSASQALAIQSAARGDAEELDRLITEALAAKTKDQKKAVKAKVKTAGRAKAKKEGRKLKMRALSDEQLSQLGAAMSAHLVKQMADLGLEADTKMTDWLDGCEADVKLGYMFGVLQGLKAAAGASVELIRT